MPLKRRSTSDRSSEQLSDVLVECALSKRYPTLIAFVTQQKWEDGTARSLGTLSVSAGDGSWKLCLNDRDSGEFAFVSGKSLTELLTTAEKLLDEMRLDWRRSSYTHEKKKK